MNIFSYGAGIQRAESEGRIVRGETMEDLHGIESPAGSVSHCNTRGIEPLAMKLLQGMGRQEQLRVLLLGCGSGNAGYDIQQLVPTAEVHGVALTAHNPYQKVALSFADIYRQVVDLVGFDVLHARRMETTYGREHEEERQRFIAMADDEYAMHKRMIVGSEPRTDQGTHVPTSLIEELQSQGKIQAFTSLDQPSVHRQYIGNFPAKIVPEGQYDCITEDHGPLYYVDQDKKGTAQDSLLAASDLLSERGLLHSEKFWPGNRAESLVPLLRQKQGRSNDLLVQDNGMHLLILRQGNLFYEPARVFATEAAYMPKKGIIQLKSDIETFLKAVLTIAA